MGLKKKTFLYSGILAAVMIAFVIGYFVLMLPSLYVDYMMDRNLRSAGELQRSYMEQRNYSAAKVRNPVSVFTMEIPDEGDEMYLAGENFRITVTMQSSGLQALLGEIRNTLTAKDWKMESKDGFDGSEEDISQLLTVWGGQLRDIFAGQKVLSADYPIGVQFQQESGGSEFYGEYYKFHVMSDDIVVYESGVSTDDYSYTTYIAMGRVEDAFVMTLLPTMTPGMEEITPIVLESLPMIAAVIVLVVSAASGFFAGKIVDPIIGLAGYAQSARISDHFEVDAFDSDRKDEIGMLGHSLYELYEKLRENYEELAQKNRLLEEDNERQEVFLRASSHQLKTPIAAALLLVEGMMNEVGKYKDTGKYLPEVKKQLLSMRGIVEDILYLNYRSGHMEPEELAVEAVLAELVRSYAVQAEDKKLKITVEGRETLTADREMFRRIADNLLSNAVQYTPEGQRIAIRIGGGTLCVDNYGAAIDEALLPHITEPFVSSDGGRKGRGLGLYVASYYSKLMGYRLEIDNIENGVRARIDYGERKRV